MARRRPSPLLDEVSVIASLRRWCFCLLADAGEVQTLEAT